MHPTEDELVRYVEHTLPPKRRRELEAHLADCAGCTSQLGFIHRVPEILKDQTAPTIDPRTLEKASNRSFRFSKVTRYAIAATIVLAVGLAGLLLLRQPEADQFRSETSTESPLMLVPRDEGQISRNKPFLQWSRIPHALAYDVTLMNESGSSVWTANTSDTSISVPSSVVLEPGKRYLWTVNAHFPDDTRLESALHVFTVSP